MFTSNTTIRQKLHEIFIREGNEVQISNRVTTTESTNKSTVHYTQPTNPVNPDPEICTQVTQVVKPDPIPVLTGEIIDLMNTKSVSLFADSDFRNLISIYLRKPELFSIMAKYVQNGNVIEESLGPVVTVDMLSDDVLANYKKSCQEIKNLGINYSDDVIMTRLIKYSGHLNLTVRSLLCGSTVESPST